MARPARPGLRDALLEATRVELGRRGAAGARVDDVARRAGVSKGAFYLHFRALEDAGLEVAQRLVGGLEALAERRHARGRRRPAAAAWRGEALRARLREEARAEADLLEHLWRHRALLPAVEVALGPRGAGLLEQFRQRQRARTADRLRALQEAGVLRDGLDPDLAAGVLRAALEDLVRRLPGLQERPDLDGQAAAILELLFRGFLTDRSDSGGRPLARPPPRPPAASAPRVTPPRRRARLHP